MQSTSVCLAETFCSWYHLALLKITLTYACMCIYCYVPIIIYMSVSIYLYAHAYVCDDGELNWTIYMTLIGYTIYNTLGMLVNECIPNITDTNVTAITCDHRKIVTISNILENLSFCILIPVESSWSSDSSCPIKQGQNLFENRWLHTKQNHKCKENS